MIKNIILDRGHGSLTKDGKYTTAPSKMFKFPDGKIAYEGLLNSQITKKVGDYLKTHSEFNTIYTVAPEDPTDLPLILRVSLANKYKGKETIFISIHCNAGGGTGFEIFTTKDTTESDKLAEHIAKEVEVVYKENKLKLRYDLSDGDKDKEEDFYVLRKTNCPAVLLECGFFDNKEDFKLLSNEDFQFDLAHKIYLGILNYTDEKS